MIGVGVLAFRRPSYLRRLMASLEAQTDKGNFDVHLFLDGATNPFSGKTYAKQESIDECKRVYMAAKIPNRCMHIHGKNVGVGVNSFEAIQKLTSSYERVMLLEGDVVLSPHWMRMARTLFDEMPGDAFSFSPGFKRIGDDPNEMLARRTYMWCECFKAKAWERVLPFYLTFYEQFIVNQDYYDRDLDAIREWHKSWGYEEVVTSQDGGRLTAIKTAGLKRYQCAVNRAIGIGQYGIHFSPERFKAMEFDRQKLNILPDDATREGWVWND